MRAAAEAIAERGIANVRVSDVAERAGMGSGHVTYYFPTKEDLLVRAIRLSEEGLAAAVAASLGDIDDPWERLDHLVAMSAASGRRDPGWVLWFQLWTSAYQDPAIAKVHDELDAAWRILLADVIGYGCARGSFETPDPELSARLLSATIDGLSIQLTVGSAELNRRELLQLCRQQAELLLRPT